LEVRLTIHATREVVLVEAKSGATINQAFLQPLDPLRELLVAYGEPKPVASRLMFGGSTGRRTGTRVVPWSSMDSIDWA
jgi:hypothetical protein